MPDGEVSMSNPCTKLPGVMESADIASRNYALSSGKKAEVTILRPTML
jgi:hypothetical protein